MSAPGITYSGVLAEKNASVSADGGVFRGLKFWVSVRVPERKTCVDAIQKNGGEIVQKEASADMLICDPTKEPALGSYSYRLILDAIREGSLDIKENYKCSSAAAFLSRCKPPTKPKLIRNQFTAKEDQILIRFVTEKERLGERIGGNDIYKKFAKEHPQHSWQSWRDRWVKKLRNIPHQPASDREQPPQPQPKRSPIALHQEKNDDKRPIAKTMVRFTAEEDDILLETIHHAIQNHEPWNGYEPYKRLASELPQRTYATWRERALNYVAKQNKDRIMEWVLKAGVRLSDEEGVNRKSSPTDSENGDAIVPAINDSRKDNATSVGSDGDDDNDDDGRHQDTVSSPMQKAGSTGIEPSTDHNASNQPASSPVVDTPQLPDHGISITTKEQFYRDYNTFLESAGVTNRRIPSVGGRAIALWDLWQSVRSKQVEAVELDWQEIAEDLGFNWVAMERVTSDLQKCYEEYLEPFADAMMSFNDSGEEDSIEDNADIETEELLPSSPPMLPSLKFTPTLMDRFPQPSPKRRRIDRSHEIPSTPEVPSRSYLQPFADIDTTPTTSPFGKYGVAAPQVHTQSDTKNEGSDEMRDRLENLPVQPQGRKRRLELETQDFYFDSNTQIHAPDESDTEPQTPSQQLLLESDAASPELHYNAPASIAPHQEMMQTTPTPRRKFRAPPKLDGSDGDIDNIQQKMKITSSARAPASTRISPPKPRVLPSSWISKSPTAADSNIQQNRQSSFTPVPETKPHRKPAPLKETPDDVIDHFVSLGYTRDIVLRSLKATSWIIGNAGQVMEMLKQGEPLPPRTTGVWTQRDDDSLILVYYEEPSSDEKMKKKRLKEMRRLEAKHGAEQIALRKTYLLDEVQE